MEIVRPMTLHACIYTIHWPRLIPTNVDSAFGTIVPSTRTLVGSTCTQYQVGPPSDTLEQL